MHSSSQTANVRRSCGRFRRFTEISRIVSHACKTCPLEISIRARTHLSALLLLSTAFALATVAVAQPACPDAYERALRSFARAQFYKPQEVDPESLSFKLAPLLLQESLATNAPLADSPGALSTHPEVDLNPAEPAVYFSVDTLELKGKPHTRFSYLWFYPQGGQRPAGGSLPVQGVQITLSSSGIPALWEVLADTSGCDLLFVSQNLESAATLEYGKPLPGRKFSIEAATNQAPKILVARILDDGPVPMGPIVYLSAGSRDVSTLICRCMPAQAKTLTGTSTYALLPRPPGIHIPAVVRAGVPLGTFWPGETNGSARLEKSLRLPSSF